MAGSLECWACCGAIRVRGRGAVWDAGCDAYVGSGRADATRAAAGAGNQVLCYFARNETRGDGCAVVVQDRNQVRGVDSELVDQQRAHLSVPVLFDYEHVFVAANELVDGIGEGKRAHAQAVSADSAAAQGLEGLIHGGRGGAEINHAYLGRRITPALDGLRKEVLGGFQLA